MAKKLVVTDHAFNGLDHERRTAEHHGATFEAHECTSEAATVEAVRGAAVVLVNFAPITGAVLREMEPGATVIRYGVGYDNVDVAAATTRGIRVANVPDYGTETVADHATASLLALARRLPHYDRRIRDEGWLRPGAIGSVPSLRSLTVGFVGMGRIAEAVHDRLRAFGCRFVAHDPYCDPGVLTRRSIESVGLEELAARSDAISLHARSTPETFQMIGSEFLDRLRPGTIIVNTARGTLIDEKALIAALERGTIVGAALDVTDPEPVPRTSLLRSFDQVVLTPHAAFFDDDSLLELQRLACEEAGRALRGEPLRCPVAP